MSDIQLIMPTTGEFIAYKKAFIVDKITCRKPKNKRKLKDEAADKEYTENNLCIIKLKIPKNALRVNPVDPIDKTQHKCRADKVIVLGFETLDGKEIKLEKNQMVISLRAMSAPAYYNRLMYTSPYWGRTINIYKINDFMRRKEDYLVYEKGKCIEANIYDPDRSAICSFGIHFFMSRRDAVDFDF